MYVCVGVRETTLVVLVFYDMICIVQIYVDDVKEINMSILEMLH